MSRFIFVVDTEQYAGNFERSMFAIMTGMVDEYGLATDDDLAAETLEEMGLDSDTYDNPFYDMLDVAGDYNDHNNNSHVSIWGTPGWFNDGMGGHFRDGQEDEAKEHYRKSCLKRAGEKVHPNDQAAYEVRWKENAEKPLQKHTAFQSVAVFFLDMPIQDIINDLFRRAKKYAEANDIKVTGYRLIQEETICTVVQEGNV